MSEVEILEGGNSLPSRVTVIQQSRKLNSAEERLLRDLEGIVAKSKLEKLRVYWESGKEPEQPSWLKRNFVYFLTPILTLFLASDLYFKGVVSSAYDYSVITGTLNYLVVVLMFLIASAYFIWAYTISSRLGKKEEKFLNFEDVKLLRKGNKIKNLPFLALCLVFLGLYFLNGNVITGIIFLLSIATIKKKIADSTEKTLSDLDTSF